MAQSKLAKLKLYTEDAPKPVRPPMELIGSLPAVLRDFKLAIGWSLSYVAGSASEFSSSRTSASASDLSWSAPVNPGVGATLGHLRLEAVGAVKSEATVKPPTAARRKKSSGVAAAADSAPNADKLQPLVPLESARALASSLAGMLGELLQTRHALWQREAELAAGVPCAPHVEEGKHLAARLQSVLRGGAEAIGCQAAALYLLDDATSELKLRSCCGLPLDRLTVPARPLQGAVADLEALLGHAVVLEDTDVLRHWNVPEAFPAAVCVPVSSPTMILGTLWLFANTKRDFDSRQTNIAEIVAGRLAADLEREVLMREGIAGAGLKKQISSGQRLQSNQLPTISPLLDGWHLSGWTEQSDSLGGDFHDWFCLPDGLLATAVGHAMDRGVEAALAATAMKAALRAHGQYCREAHHALKRLNLTTWTGSAGDQHGTLFYGLIQTSTGRICCSSAGNPGVIVVRPRGWQSLSVVSPRLGESPESDFAQYGYELQPGEALVIFTEGVCDAIDAQGRPFGESGVAESLMGHLDLSADQLAALVRGRIDSFATAPGCRDRTVLVVKRTSIA